MKPLSLVKCKQDAAYADFLTGAYSDVRDQRKTQVQQCIAQHFTCDLVLRRVYTFSLFVSDQS